MRVFVVVFDTSVAFFLCQIHFSLSAINISVSKTLVLLLPPPSSFSHTGTPCPFCLCSQSQSPSTIFLLGDSGPGKHVAAHRCIRYLQESDMYGFFFPILHRARSAVSVLAKPLTPARKSWMFFTELLLGFKEKPVRKMDLIPFRGADHFYALRESAGETHIPTCT